MKLSSAVKSVFSKLIQVAQAAPPSRPPPAVASRDRFEASRNNPVDLGRAPPASSAGDAEFVTGLYRDLLGRAPDAGGLQAHLKGLETGMSREEIRNVFLTSPEFRSRQGAGTPGAGDALAPTRLKTAEDPGTTGYVNTVQNRTIAPKSTFLNAVHAAIDAVQAQGIGIDPNDRSQISDFDAYHQGVVQQLLKAGYLAAYDGEELAVGRRGDQHSEQFDISTWQGGVRRFYASWQTPPAFAQD
ncbi:MAG: hypothetical protein H6Q89_2464 [Myxococcaceae bacterium]|nr:hypothetical protein [Myxococcaceae bacterium]